MAKTRTQTARTRRYRARLREGRPARSRVEAMAVRVRRWRRAFGSWKPIVRRSGTGGRSTAPRWRTHAMRAAEREGYIVELEMRNEELEPWETRGPEWRRAFGSWKNPAVPPRRPRAGGGGH